MRAQTSTKNKPVIYRGFTGLNTSTSEVALEAPDAQPFLSMDNAYCAAGGYLTNELPTTPVGPEKQAVIHLRRYAAGIPSALYAARTAGAVELRSTDVGSRGPSWPRNSVVASSVLNRKVIATTLGQTPVVFDGTSWVTMASSDAVAGPAFSTSVARRAIYAGYARNPTEVVVSRVDQEGILASDEAPGDASVLKGFRFNVQNYIATADVITGIAPFGASNLAIFTNDRAMVWAVNEDATRWGIDSSAKINVGCVSHNSICAVDDVLLFCSRNGVHAIRRSVQSGALVYARPISAAIERVYRRLLAMVKNPQAISACYDRDTARYTVFFPVNDTYGWRLVLDIKPRTNETGELVGNWATSDYGGILCGDSLAGITMFGTASGLRRQGLEIDDAYGARGAAEAITPVLWHGDYLEPKRSHSLILYASGKGTVRVSASDEAGRDLGEVTFELTDPLQVPQFGDHLIQQFSKSFQHCYCGLRLRFTIEDGLEQVRVFAFGVRLAEI